MGRHEELNINKGKRMQMWGFEDLMSGEIVELNYCKSALIFPILFYRFQTCEDKIKAYIDEMKSGNSLGTY